MFTSRNIETSFGDTHACCGRRPGVRRVTARTRNPGEFRLLQRSRWGSDMGSKGFNLLKILARHLPTLELEAKHVVPCGRANRSTC